MFRSAPRWLQALLVGQFVTTAGSLAWLFLTLYLVDARGLPTRDAGLVTATFGLGTVAGNLFGGGIGDRIGLKHSLVLSMTGWIACCAAFPLAPTVLLAPVALAAGLTSGAERPLMSALIVSSLPADHRREGIALSRAAQNAGLIIGPPVGGLVAVHHFNAIFAFDAATSAVFLVTVLRWCREAERVVGTDGPRNVVAALRGDRAMVRLLVSVLAVDTTYRLLYTVLPLFLVAKHAPTVLYGLTVSINCVVIVAFEPRLARRLSGYDAVRVIATGYALVGAGWLLLGAVPAVVMALVAVVVITAGEMLYKPTATARAADLAPPSMVGRYQSLYAAASIGGMLLAPLLGTAVYATAPRLVWPAAGVLALAAAAFVTDRRG